MKTHQWFIGIDISKSTLDITIYNKLGRKNAPYLKIENTEQGFQQFLEWLNKEQICKTSVWVCMEHTGVYGWDIACFLSEKRITYSMLSPLQVSRSLGIKRGKNDRVDSYQLARFCWLHQEELKACQPPSEALRDLKGLLNERARLVKMRVMEKQVLSELGKQCTKATVKRTQMRLDGLNEDIKEIEQEMLTLIESDKEIEHNYALVISVTGIGVVNAVTFIIFTNNFKGVTDARKYACFSGIAPFQHQSGSSIRGKTKVSKLANSIIKVNLTQGAKAAIIHDPELKIYYQRKREEGKEHGTVMNAVKFKLVNRVFAVVKRGTPFVKLRQAG